MSEHKNYPGYYFFKDLYEDMSCLISIIHQIHFLIVKTEQIIYQ